MGWLHYNNEVSVPEFEITYIHGSMAIKRKPLRFGKLDCSRIRRKAITTIQATGSSLFTEATSVHLCQRTTANIPIANENQPLKALWQRIGESPIGSNLRQKRVAEKSDKSIF